MTTRPRVLIAVTVYNGRDVVPRTLRSAACVRASSIADVDVLVLDDASPEPGWSLECANYCRELGLQYYRAPRNLGIPRNVSLGLRFGVDAGYDFVIIANSDVVFPGNLVDGLVATASGDPRIASVTAWSNNVSAYSLDNEDPDRFLGDQRVVDLVSLALNEHFGAAALDVPAGISFAILFPTSALRLVGFMDPAFDRGYCEETDWSLRAIGLGLRVCLAPGVFAYHQGRGSNVSAQLVSGHHTTVPENEAVIDHRYPLFRGQVDAFLASGILEEASMFAVDRVLTRAASAAGWTIVPTAGGDGDQQIARADQDLEPVVCRLSADATRPVRLSWRGFAEDVHLGEDPVTALTERFGATPIARIADPVGQR